MTAINLNSNNLNGTLPDLTALTEVTNMQLMSNPLLGGNISAVQGMSNLTTLHMLESPIQGDIGVYATLPNITHTFASYALSGDISVFSGNTTIRDLRLWS